MKRQTADVLEMLRARPDGVCGPRFLAARIGRFGARIGELRAAGFGIGREVCRDRRHRHRTRQWRYTLEREPS